MRHAQKSTNKGYEQFTCIWKYFSYLIHIIPADDCVKHCVQRIQKFNNLWNENLYYFHWNNKTHGRINLPTLWFYNERKSIFQIALIFSPFYLCIQGHTFKSTYIPHCSKFSFSPKLILFMHFVGFTVNVSWL